MSAELEAIERRIRDWLWSTSEMYAGPVGSDEWVEGLARYLANNPHAPTAGSEQ